MREAAERKATEEAARRERQELETAAGFDRRLQSAGEEAQRALEGAAREAATRFREAPPYTLQLTLYTLHPTP